MTPKLLPLLMFVATAASPAMAAVDAGNAAAYAVRVPVLAAPDAPLQRLLLPAQALVRLQSGDLSDLRLFNAAGQALPIALADVAVQAQAGDQLKLAAYPILGGAGTTGLEGLSLRIEERNGKRVVQLNGGGTATTTGGPQKVLGALLDARAVKAPVSSLSLDADLPAGQPVTFEVQASKDLKNWRSLAETVLYRAAGADSASTLGNTRLELGSVDLAGQYLRISWGDAAVTLRGASLNTSRGAAQRQRVDASMAAPKLVNAHEFSFALPFATPVAALKIVPPAGNVLVPVRVFGRNERSQAWTPLAGAVVYRLAGGGKEQVNGPIELSGASVREIRVEADAKTPGFASAPEITLQFEPAQIVFLAGGAGPFTLAAGLAGAPAAYLPLASLMPGYKAGQENSLPLAQADGSKAEGSGATQAGPLVAAQSAGDGVPTRSLVLWGILVGGALLLALMAWVLLKQTRKPEAATGA